MSELEIRSNFPWPSCALSNFAKWPFVMDGIQFGGLEGFLQGCKVRNHEQQKRIFGMSGLAAQQSGRAYARVADRGTLFWLEFPFQDTLHHGKSCIQMLILKLRSKTEGFAMRYNPQKAKF